MYFLSGSRSYHNANNADDDDDAHRSVLCPVASTSSTITAISAVHRYHCQFFGPMLSTASKAASHRCMQNLARLGRMNVDADVALPLTFESLYSSLALLRLFRCWHDLRSCPPRPLKFNHYQHPITACHVSRSSCRGYSLERLRSS